MGAIHDTALVLVGTWLFLYRFPLRTQKFGAIAENLTTACCGLSLSLLAPLLPWPPPGFRALPLALLGMLFAFCHPAFTAMVVTVPLGIGLGALVWQLGLCSVVPDYHAVILSVFAVAFVLVFVCTPGVAGVQSLRNVLVPSLSALLLTTAIAGLVPSLGALEPRSLLLAAPCAADGGDTQAPLISLGCWLAVAACAIGLQLFFWWLAQREEGREAAGGGRGDLVTSLLPGAEKGDDDDAFQKPEDLRTDRFQVLVKAIFAEEGADQSHLTDHEKRLVEVCRQDEFERDRLLWGGGLI